MACGRGFSARRREGEGFGVKAPHTRGFWRGFSSAAWGGEGLAWKLPTLGAFGAIFGATALRRGFWRGFSSAAWGEGFGVKAPHTRGF